MKAAHDFASRFGLTMSEALKAAWANAKFYVKSTSQVVHFLFRKVDGSLREAFGTLQASLLPATSSQRTPNKYIQVYYDTEKQEWRCFKKQNLIAVY